MITISGGGRGNGKTSRMMDKMEELLAADQAVMVITHNVKLAPKLISDLEQRGCPARFFVKCHQLKIIESGTGLENEIARWTEHKYVFVEAVGKHLLPKYKVMEENTGKMFTVLVQETRGTGGIVEEEFRP